MGYIPVIILLLITVLARGFVRGTDEAPAVPALTPFEIEQMPAPGIADTSCNRITGNVQALEGLFGEFARLERGEEAAARSDPCSWAIRTCRPDSSRTAYGAACKCFSAMRDAG
ncbi:MAG: hypothetical protein ACLR8Y_07060 [Alistipes indistinctus]